jgi:membrane fusion protein (multidrug efflux system)
MNKILTTSSLAQENGANPSEARSGLRLVRPALTWGAAIVAALVIAAWLHHRYTHVSTDDARIHAWMITVSSTVPGRLDEVAIQRGDHLEPGSIISRLDSRGVTLKLAELLAEKNAVQADYNRVVAEREMVARQSAGDIDAARSRRTAASAALVSAESELQFSQRELERSNTLQQSSVISDRLLDSAKNDWKQSEQGYQQALAGVDSRKAELARAQANAISLDVLASDLTRLQHELSRMDLMIQRQQVIIDETTVLSPSRGVVDKVFVDTGEFVIAGQRLMLMHDTETIWVEANIKETEIRHLNVGDKVDIKVDAYPNRAFTGTLTHIGDAATSQFSLLPSTNPSGNFTKTTQRVPVRISTEQMEGLLRPGMMVEVDIEIR